MIPNFNSIFNFFKQRIFLDNNEKQFVKFNKLKWNFFKLKKTNKKTPIIMVDLFPWYPSIYLWSYMTNLLSKKINGKIKFYYFDFFYFSIFVNYFNFILIYIRKNIHICCKNIKCSCVVTCKNSS